MLQSRNLDDQSFEEIVEYALGRLPWLCPAWTNHNPSDPGVTLIELMAWYKEMQQYHMNCFTPAMERKLLKLAGTEPLQAAPAVCRVDLPGREPDAYPVLSRLETAEGVPFELREPIPARRASLCGCYVEEKGKLTDVSDLLREEGIGLLPFSFGQAERTELLLGFDALPEGSLPLWAEVSPVQDPPRNPFADPAQAPRRLRWTFEGAGEARPLEDETHGLSVSGRLRFDLPEDWRKTAPAGAPEAWYLRAALEDPGCEEDPRLLAVSVQRYAVSQTETWAERRSFRVEARADCRVLFGDALAESAAFTAFLRTAEGWEQAPELEEIADGGTRGVRLDAGRAAADGAENLMIVCADPIHYGDLFFDSDGLPNMTLPLELGARRALPDRLEFLCDTLGEEGAVRPALWRCVEDLSSCSPRDRAFTYDPDDESVTFGDGRHGAVVPRGKTALLCANLVLSDGAGGNIPAGESLRFQASGRPVHNTAAAGGRDAETVEEAAARFLKKLSRTEKCVSAADYESAARRTPGLRVAAARAIPGYDPDEPTGRCDRPVVTVVVIPGSRRDRPVPDQRFLEAVQSWMDRHRPICTEVRVVPPRYVPVSAAVRLKTNGQVSAETVRAALEDFLRIRPGGRGIGESVVKNDAAMELQKIPGVLKVGSVELSAAGADCWCSAAGDVIIPRTAVPFLRGLEADLR